MKRYALFGGDDYYPQGGMKDILSYFDDKERAIGFAEGFCQTCLRWAHVVDTTNGEIVFETRSEK